jgi:hypothetical protein
VTDIAMVVNGADLCTGLMVSSSSTFTALLSGAIVKRDPCSSEDGPGVVMLIFAAASAVSGFAAGGTVVFIALVSLGIRREEATYTLTEPTPDRVASSARVAQ